MTDTTMDAAALASNTFLEKNALQSISINAYDLLTSNKQRILNTELEKNNQQLIADHTFYIEHEIPEVFRYLDLHILVLKNETVVIGHSAPKDITEYHPETGRKIALKNVISKVYDLLAVEFKEKVSSKQYVDSLYGVESDFITSANFTFTEKPFTTYAFNLSAALQYHFESIDFNHSIEDTVMVLGYFHSNGRAFYDYHQAISHDAYDETSCRNYALVKTVINLTNSRIMLLKSQQQA